MNKISKILIIFLTLSLLLSLTSCLRTDIGVEIKEGPDGKLTGTLSAKISIAETLYENLVNLGQGEGVESQASNTGGDGTPNEGDEIDLNEFVKEEIDGETYYSYTFVQDNLTLQELVDELYEFEVREGTKLFQNDVIINHNNGYFEFSGTTEIITNDNVSGDGNLTIEDDWLVLTLTVKMPGEVVETTGEIIGDKENGTVRFVIDDFTAPRELKVKTEPVVDYAPLLVLWGVGLVAIVFCLIMFVKSRNKINKKREALRETGRDVSNAPECEENEEKEEKEEKE